MCVKFDSFIMKCPHFPMPSSRKIGFYNRKISYHEKTIESFHNHK